MEAPYVVPDWMNEENRKAWLAGYADGKAGRDEIRHPTLAYMIGYANGRRDPVRNLEPFAIPEPQHG